MSHDDQEMVVSNIPVNLDDNNLKKMGTKLKKVKKVIIDFGYQESDLYYFEQPKMLMLRQMVLFGYDEKDKLYVISFSSDCYAIGAVQLMHHLFINGIKNIKFLENFFIGSDQKVYFADTADEKFKEELKDDLMQQNLISTIQAQNETFH